MEDLAHLPAATVPDPNPSVGDGAASSSLDQFTSEEEQTLLMLQQLDSPALVIFWQRDHANSEAVLQWADACASLAGNSFTLVPLEYARHPGLARWMGVVGVPEVLMVLHGRVVDRLDGDYGRFSHWIVGAGC